MCVCNRYLLHLVFRHHHAQHQSPQPQRERQTQSTSIFFHEQRHQQRGRPAHRAAHGQRALTLISVSCRTSGLSHVGHKTPLFYKTCISVTHIQNQKRGTKSYNIIMYFYVLSNNIKCQMNCLHKRTAVHSPNLGQFQFIYLQIWGFKKKKLFHYLQSSGF